MKFIDSIKLQLKAGDGGDGNIAFRHELYVPKGGPSGGDGGNGADIYFVGDENTNTLFSLYNKKIIKAENGENGGKNNCHGKKAQSLFIQVPVGTLIKDISSNKIICDITKHKQNELIVSGGHGGRGNARFASSKNRAPRVCEKGELGEELIIICELKLLADIGIIGLPNAGKSTLLSKISSSRPVIRDYPFTTLSPQLGVVSINNHSFVVSDLPGLIKGASHNKGLGHQFLKHAERCLILLHLIDISSLLSYEQIIDNYLIIRNELKLYSLDLYNKPEIIVFNKSDQDTNFYNFKKLQFYFLDQKNIQISALCDKNFNHLKAKMWNVLEEFKLKKSEDEKINKSNGLNDLVHVIKFENDNQSINIEKISHNIWNITGKPIEKILRIQYSDQNYNLAILNEKLKKLNVFKRLKKLNINENDIVKVYSHEFEWHENES